MQKFLAFLRNGAFRAVVASACLAALAAPGCGGAKKETDPAKVQKKIDEQREFHQKETRQRK